MKDELFEKENNIELTDAADIDTDNLEPMPLEASEELIEDLIEESRLDSEELEKVLLETEEAIAKSESQDDVDEAELLDEVGEGLLADDELDEMELVSDYDYSEDTEAEPLVSAEENLEEPTKISELIETTFSC